MFWIALIVSLAPLAICIAGGAALYLSSRD